MVRPLRKGTYLTLILIHINNHPSFFVKSTKEHKFVIGDDPSEYVFRTIDIIHKEGENSYKESAEQITYYNTNIENIKNIVAEVQQIYSWMNISY